MIKESLTNNETYVDASQKSKFPLLWLFWELWASFKHFMGPKECSKGVHDVHRSYFYTAAIFTSKSLYTGGKNSCGATVFLCTQQVKMISMVWYNCTVPILLLYL